MFASHFPTKKEIIMLEPGRNIISFEREKN
jgi:hypothetical protein